MYVSNSIIYAITNTCSDVIVEQHKETTTTTTTSAAAVQQSEEAPQISTLKPTFTSSLQGHESVPDTSSTINQPLVMPAMSGEKFQSPVEQPSNVTRSRKRRSSAHDPQQRKVLKNLLLYSIDGAGLTVTEF